MTKDALPPTVLLPKIGASARADEGKQEGPLPHCGDCAFRIARDGDWYYHDSLIARKSLVRLFSTILQCDDAGQHWLVTPVERVQVEVEDAPFLAVELDVVGNRDTQILRFRTNVDNWVDADHEHPITMAAGSDGSELRPYVLVRSKLRALIARPIFYQLVELAQERMVDGNMMLGVVSRGNFFVLGSPS